VPVQREIDITVGKIDTFYSDGLVEGVRHLFRQGFILKRIHGCSHHLPELVQGVVRAHELALICERFILTALFYLVLHETRVFVSEVNLLDL
jgi:hypothetical protein